MKLVRYCNARCQKNHWSKHKQICKQRAAELRDEALFTDPPAKEECPICFLLMPLTIISCMSLPPATISSVPIYNFAIAPENEFLANLGTPQYYSCCGKSICGGCIYSFTDSGNIGTCLFCKTNLIGKTDEDRVEEMMNRVEANDASSICELGSCYYVGKEGLQQDHTKAKILWTQAAELGSRDSHYHLGKIYDEGRDFKKSKFHYESAAMAGNEHARYNLAIKENNLNPYNSENVKQAIKHCIIAASAGNHQAMHMLVDLFKQRDVSRGAIDSTLTAYNNSCVEMRSEARDAYMKKIIHDSR